MPRSYQHISDYEKEILELKSQGMTLREIGENLDLHTDKYTISLPDTTKNSE